MKRILSAVLAVCLLVSVCGFLTHGVYEESAVDAVQVCVTLSNDGTPLCGNDSDRTVLAGLDVTVPYFDLALYGLSDFYRLNTNKQIIARPTMLHLCIYLAERYYMGLPVSECGKGTSGVLGYKAPTTMEYMNGKEAYTSGGKGALVLSGSASTAYMNNFWGHDENLMYFRNHTYPKMTDTLGATVDYILLSQGDVVDVAMFSDWDFWSRGRFLSFDKDVYTANIGEPLTYTAMQSDARSFADGGAGTVPATDVTTSLYDADWNPITQAQMTKPGSYYMLCTGADGCSAPGVAKVQVGTKVQLQTEKEKIFAGGTVPVTMTLGHTLEQVLSFDWQVRFDSDLFTLESSTVGNSHKDVRISNLKTDENGQFYSVSFVDRTANGATMQSGTVCTLTFRAKADIEKDQSGTFALVSEGVWSADKKELPVSGGDTQTVTVEKIVPAKLEVTKLPDKTSYNYKDSLNTAGLVLTLHYNNGDTETVTTGYTYTPKAFTVDKGLPLFGLKGKIPVTVSYQGLTTTFSVQVRLSPLQWVIKILLFGWIWY